MGRYYILSVKREFYARRDPLSYYTEKKFLQRYRLTKAVTRQLIKDYVAYLPRKRRVLRGVHAVPHRIRFCIALRYFATGANYSTIADCHGVSISTVCRSVQEISDYFHNVLEEFVVWPDSALEKNNKSVLFLREKRKPGVFGLVDGTHVPIACPKGVVADENQYYCYKGYYSINTMIICDWDSVIFHVNASNPGSCNDVYVMNGSQVKYLGERGDFSGFFLLGDGGYTLTDYVYTPVNPEVTDEDVKFNKWHKKLRSKVERTIGQLKQRWRCLDSSGGYLMHEPRRAACIIESCVALHNIARIAKIKILRDFPAKDNFKRKRPPVDQPENRGPKPRLAFKNLREGYIKKQFGPRVARR